MASVIRATTPTIKYTFNVISVSDIAAAYLTIRQDGEMIIERDLTSATVGNDYLSWTFTQQETLQMATGKVTLMLNWLTNDGTRGASEKSTVVIEGNYKNEVI